MSLAPNPPPRPPPPPPLPGFFVRLGSFVNMFDEDRCSEWFAKLSLSRDYHPEATLSLESFLQAHYPQYEFCNSNNPRLAKIAHKWLTSGAGLHFWRPDCANQATTPEDRIHVWDDDKPELEYGIYQLLLLEAPRMKRFFARRTLALKQQGYRARKRAEKREDECRKRPRVDEEDEEDEEDKSRKRLRVDEEDDEDEEDEEGEEDEENEADEEKDNEKNAEEPPQKRQRMDTLPLRPART